MPSTLSAAKIRRVGSLLLGLSLAAATLRLTACFVTPTPTNPHEEPDGGDPLDPADSDPHGTADAGDAG